jgi:hypothetical protein
MANNILLYKKDKGNGKALVLLGTTKADRKEENSIITPVGLAPKRNII